MEFYGRNKTITPSFRRLKTRELRTLTWVGTVEVTRSFASSCEGGSLLKERTKSDNLRGITAAVKFLNLGDSRTPESELFPYCIRAIVQHLATTCADWIPTLRHIVAGKKNIPKVLNHSSADYEAAWLRLLYLFTTSTLCISFFRFKLGKHSHFPRWQLACLTASFAFRQWTMKVQGSREIVLTNAQTTSVNLLLFGW